MREIKRRVGAVYGGVRPIAESGIPWGGPAVAAGPEPPQTMALGSSPMAS
jgi:hypothetical protein